LPRLIGGYSGVMVDKLGYANFFYVTALLGVPTVILIIWQWWLDARRKEPGAPAGNDSAGS
jgi:PAT family beta-lactamase induction signal transducer AmpG